MSGGRRSIASALARPWAVWALVVLLALAARTVAAPAAELPYGHGLLWRIERGGAPPSHVFGTLHSGDPRITRLPQAVAAALIASRALLVEVVWTPATEDQVRRASLLDEGADLEALIGRERFSRVVEAGTRYGLPARGLRRFKPWVLMTLFSMPPAELARQAAGAVPLDRALQERAAGHGIAVHGLESAAEQIALFDGLSQAEQIALLDVALQENRRIDMWWERLETAYLERDVAQIFALATEQGAAGDPALMKLLGERLIDSRNRRMVERMGDALMRGGAFVAVGALHLPGEQGILSLLARQGYTITRVY